jgi:CheY-like chemotaxis protein
VLVNLLGNALRFAQRGEILISATEDPDEKGSLRFAVKDSSSNMSNSIVASLFTPMTEVDMITARKYGGTGLGLSVSKKLVELMAGKMGVDPSADQGTTFWFSAPLQPAVESDEAPVAELSGTASNKLLLAGRASTSVAVIMTYSKSWGLDCLYQPSGAGAIEALAKQPDAYQAVIIESGLSDMSVVDFLSELFRREELSGVHAIALTEEEATEQAIKKLGVSMQVLRKPFKKAGLREALRQCQLLLRRTGEIVRPESQLKSYIASVDFATRTSIGEPTPAQSGPSKLLVVEDNPVNRRLVLLQLQNLGLECDIVENGQEAVDALEKGQYDLVFMDCWMPVLDGFAATAKIRESENQSDKHTTIVAMTANAMESDRDDCLAAGMDDYISKPVTQSALKGVIDKWLLQKRALRFHP